jgi:hypothetical protein
VRLQDAVACSLGMPRAQWPRESQAISWPSAAARKPTCISMSVGWGEVGQCAHLLLAWHGVVQWRVSLRARVELAVLLDQVLELGLRPVPDNGTSGLCNLGKRHTLALRS